MTKLYKWRKPPGLTGSPVKEPEVYVCMYLCMYVYMYIKIGAGHMCIHVSYMMYTVLYVVTSLSTIQ
jgi:hypothetical protein